MKRAQLSHLLRVHRQSLLAAAFALLLALAGCAAPAGDGLSANAAAPVASAGGNEELSRLADKYTAATKPGNGAYKIGPQDVLEITVFNVAELNRTIQVADNGSINFPLVGEVSTAGKTARMVEADLAARLNARFVKSPQVSVFVKEYNALPSMAR
jgi:polysaccharide biosynthesis/export protein